MRRISARMPATRAEIELAFDRSPTKKLKSHEKKTNVNIYDNITTHFHKILFKLSKIPKIENFS